MYYWRWDCSQLHAYNRQHADLLSWLISNTLKNHLCESYNVIFDVANATYELVNPDKTSHSKENYNVNLKAVLNRSSFNNIVKMLEMNTDNKITLIVQRIDTKFLKNHFDEM